MFKQSTESQEKEMQNRKQKSEIASLSHNIPIITLNVNGPYQQSPSVLALGTSFMEDNFSMDKGERGRQEAELGRSCEQSFTGSPTAQLLLCHPVPNRPQTGTGLQPWGWGPLV